MRISYLTLFPSFFNEFKNTSIIKKAIDKGIVSLETYDLKDYVSNGRVDDKIVGGGRGNLIRYDVVSEALKSIKKENSKVILVTPKGRVFNQHLAGELSHFDDLVFICPHFEGVDARIEDEVDFCISLGDYILTGGELASQVISDSLIRLINGVISSDSLKEETFNDDLIEYKQYTLPRVYNNKSIPEIYFSGNHNAIRDYKLKQSLLETKKLRPDLYKKHKLSDEEKMVMKKCSKKWEKEIVSKAKSKKN